MAETVEPARVTNPPDCATTTGASFPLVVKVVGPTLLRPTVVVPPVSVRIANARSPVVLTEPPLNVVWPPLLVSRPYASEPVVRMVVSVNIIVPPAATPGEAEPL